MNKRNNKGFVNFKLGEWSEVLAQIKSQDRFPPGKTYAVFFRVERAEFVTLAEAEKELLKENWHKGHFFNENQELRFEKKDENCFRIFLLAENQLLEGWEVEEFDVGGEMSFLLFGERKESDPGWREARIPRWIRYPVPDTWEHLQLIGIPYLKRGIIVRMRWKGVKEL